MKTRTGIQPDNYPNLAVGKATADADGNVIPNTYAKLGQVVRKDVLVGAISPVSDAGKNWLGNKQLLTSGRQITASGWYRIAEIPNYCKAKFNIFKQFNHDVGTATTITINSGIANRNFVLINVENSVMSDGSDNYVKQVRFSDNASNTSGYVDVYIEAAEQNAYWLSVDACYVYNSNFEIYAFESVTEAVTTNVTTVDVPKNGGSNTNKPIYQQGNPVANLSQVVRTDAAQSLTDEQKQQAQENIAITVTKAATSSGQAGWWRVAQISHNSVYDIKLTQSFNFNSPAQMNVVASVGYMDSTNAVLSLISGFLATMFTVSKIRVCGNTTACYIDIYTPDATWNKTVVEIKGASGSSISPTEFSFIGTSDTVDGYNVVILDLVSGANTSGKLYQNGSPVLVGDQSAIFESDGTTVKNATNADKVFVKTLFKGNFYLETSAKILNITSGNISDYDEIRIYFQNNVDSGDCDYLLTSIRTPSDLYYANAVPVVTGEEGWALSYVVIANGGAGENSIVFTLGKEDSAFCITRVDGVLYK